MINLYCILSTYFSVKMSLWRLSEKISIHQIRFVYAMYVYRYTTYIQYVYLPFLPVIKNISLMHLGVFFGNASVDADFIRVEVVTSSGETKSDVHMHVFPKKEALERKQKHGGIPLNVALIMFDSTSAANFKRKMPKSLEYLTTSLDSILMQGKCACVSLP